MLGYAAFLLTDEGLCDLCTPIDRPLKPCVKECTGLAITDIEVPEIRSGTEHFSPNAKNAWFGSEPVAES